jgi:hypothetical protein
VAATAKSPAQVTLAAHDQGRVSLQEPNPCSAMNARSAGRDGYLCARGISCAARQ